MTHRLGAGGLDAAQRGGQRGWVGPAREPGGLGLGDNAGGVVRDDLVQFPLQLLAPGTVRGLRLQEVEIAAVPATPMMAATRGARVRIAAPPRTRRRQARPRTTDRVLGAERGSDSDRGEQGQAGHGGPGAVAPAQQRRHADRDAEAERPRPVGGLR
jgi:hypothetical protein